MKPRAKTRRAFSSSIASETFLLMCRRSRSLPASGAIDESPLALAGEDLEDRILDRVDLDGGERDVVPERREPLEDRDDLGVVADRGRDEPGPVRQRRAPRGRP